MQIEKNVGKYFLGRLLFSEKKKKKDISEKIEIFVKMARTLKIKSLKKNIFSDKNNSSEKIAKTFEVKKRMSKKKKYYFLRKKNKFPKKINSFEQTVRTSKYKIKPNPKNFDKNSNYR